MAQVQDSDLNEAFLPKQVYPIERGSCGNWMESCSALHRDVLTGRRPPRFSIFRQPHNGLTDRLVSSVSVFLHALLTDRAFLFDWSGQHSLWDALRSSFIDWRYDRDSPPERGVPAEQQLLLDFMGANGQGDHRGPEHAVFYKWFTDTQLQDVGSNASVLIWSVNRGLVWKAATSNAHIKQRLRSMGLNPVNIFGCLFNFLYRPTPAAMARVAPLLLQLLDPSIFKIGLQIRTGDEHLAGGKPAKQFEDAFEWFHCARVAEHTWKPPGQQSVWFLLTDSPGIRRGAARYLGKQVATLADALLGHTLHAPAGAKGKAAAILGLAAAETWLFSLMDVHVISQLSGFGRMGAMMAGGWGHIIQLPAGMWSLAGYEANLTYLARPGESGAAEAANATQRAMMDAGQCNSPSQAAGPAFCWPEEPPGPPPAMDGSSPMSLKMRHLCSKATPMQEVVMAHTGARRRG
ncbi:hypothetical protein OEZ85_004133 [Tetradesmus obliquus]|uniref:Uncharacterized protein n=1 Tax=Tetradesmus obliquus TaxID=3088 RepID=A0ABY8UDI8_TETOB|nr:hypothetical protein OEZ85_004133 [Tetradesmus obliquus]